MEDGIKISELSSVQTITGTDIIPVVSNDETKNATISQVATYTNGLLPTPKYCVATITTTPTISSNYYVPLNSTPKNEGNFTLQDGGIKIPSGINCISVSGSVFINGWPAGTGYLWVRIIRKRGTQEFSVSGSINGSPSAYMSSSVPSTIIDVQEGDIIKLMADSGSGGTIRAGAENTWLCVEKIS